MSQITEQNKTTENIETSANIKEKKLGFSLKVFLCLQILLFITSFSSVFTKKAAGEPFLSLRFCIFYAGVLFLCVVNALFWQQIIKRLPLTFAYSNRAIGIIWAMLWSRLFFGDVITPKKIVGIAIIITGIVLYSFWGYRGED